MKILFVASEAHPFAKTGGLGDVTYALPKALRKLGVDVRVIMPKYLGICTNFGDKLKYISSFNVPVGWRDAFCAIEYYQYEGVPFYFIDNEYYFKRADIYGFFDDGERYSYFCRAVLEFIEKLDDFKPDIIHCNDWHSGMIPLLLNEHYKKNGKLQNVKTIFTIHNLKYQGVFPKEVLPDLLSLGYEYFTEEGVKYYDCISFMKAGINYGDIITTVSDTYSEEIKEEALGEGLHGLLNARGHKFSGIVNGLDFDLFNPGTDEDIFCKYSLHDLENKYKNKTELQKLLGLPVNETIPMIGIVSRLVKQKGFDLIAHVIEELLSMDIQLVVLGAGEEDYEDLFQYYSSIYPTRLSSNIAFSNSLAKKIYAASDMFLMPSIYEPCGIGQLIALRYGVVPIVRETGGLKDTVEPYNQYTGQGTGFSFANYNADEMLNTIKYAIETYYQKEVWENLIKRGMVKDNSWTNSANLYIRLYETLL